MLLQTYEDLTIFNLKGQLPKTLNNWFKYSFNLTQAAQNIHISWKVWMSKVSYGVQMGQNEAKLGPNPEI